MPVHANCTNSVHVVTLLQGSVLMLKEICVLNLNNIQLYVYRSFKKCRRAILAVINTTHGVLKIRPEKVQACMGFEPTTSVTPVQCREYLKIIHVFITVRIAFTHFLQLQYKNVTLHAACVQLKDTVYLS